MAAILLALPLSAEEPGLGPALVRRVTGVALRSEAERAPEGAVRSGAWIDVRGTEGALLYRRAIRDPLFQSFEIFDEKGVHGEPFELRRFGRLRPDVDPSSMVSFAVIPDLPQAAFVEVHATRWGTLGDRRARVVGRFALDALAPLPATPAPKVARVDWLLGDENRRRLFAFLPDGFTAGEIGDFHVHAKRLAEALTQDPAFAPIVDKIGIVRLDIESKESGADDPKECGGSGAAPDTALDASHCFNGSRRLVSIDAKKLIAALDSEKVANSTPVVVVNSKQYGGGGWGWYATVTITPPRKGADWRGVALHEIGHAFGLDEEYDHDLFCGDGNHEFCGPEPIGANVSMARSHADLKKQGKWSVDKTVEVPTVLNPNPKRCDERTFHQLGLQHRGDVVGTFEGAAKYHSAVFRPQYQCRMRNTDEPFCRVCSDHIAASI